MTNKALLSVIEAQKKILDEFSPKSAIEIEYHHGYGYVLAEEILAPIDLPPFNNSSMDGYAVLSSDTEGATEDQPKVLKIIEDIPAGSYPKKAIQSGTTSRIMTGAPLPEGADAVIPVEYTSNAKRYFEKELTHEVSLYKEAYPGDYIRQKGEDIHKGKKIFAKGHFLRSQDIGMLSGLGIKKISVHNKPSVALLTSGDEIVKPGEGLKSGQIYDVNTAAIQSVLEKYGAKVHSLGVAKDTYQNVKASLDQAENMRVDLIVSTAGVSLGAYDYIKQVVEDHGTLSFWRVNIRPGKPLTFGNYNGIPFIGLPGNPVSAFIGSLLFIKPALDKLSGKAKIEPDYHEAILTEDVHSDGRESYLRVVVEKNDGGHFARLSAHQGSGNIFSLVAANALLIMPAGVKSLPKGSKAKFFYLD